MSRLGAATGVRRKQGMAEHVVDLFVWALAYGPGDVMIVTRVNQRGDHSRGEMRGQVAPPDP